jgi:hypothetical protein
MSLKNIVAQFGHKQKEKPKTFLAVEISSETIKSALWTVEDGKTKIIKIGSLQEWDGKNKKLLLTAVDISISHACEKAELEPEGLIFGLPEDWLEKEEILEEKKELLKFICQKLALKPLGFVVNLEALVTYLKSKEGTPISAIFINLQEDQSLISLVLLGKIQGTKIVGRSEDLAADVKEGLARFDKIENLPARMIIFNGTSDWEEYKQQLVSFDWLEKLPFLHFPKVETLGVNKSIEAVAIAGGTEVAKSLGFTIKETERKGKEEIKEEAEEEKEPAVKSEESSAGGFGFIQDQDITQVSPEPQASPEKEEEKQSEEIIPPAPPKTKTYLVRSNSLVAKAKTFIRQLFFNLRLFSLGGKKRLTIVLIVLAFLLFSGGALAFYWYVPHAKVILYFTPKTLEEKLKVTIPAEQKTITVEDKKTKATTGEKIVGDEAKGEVIVYNKTDVVKSFAAGTILVGPDNLQFTLDEETSVASRSSELGEEGEQIIYGKTAAQITAANIGTESNLAGGSNFTFKAYSDNLYSAKTEEGLTGGTSRQIKVVSAEDISSLLKELKTELKEKAGLKLQEELSSEKEILKESLEEESLDENFSAAKGEESNQLELELKVNFSAFVYHKTDLEEALSASIKDKISEGFIFNPEKTAIETKEIKIKEEEAEIAANIKAYLLPKINFEEVKTHLVGTNPEKSEAYLGSLPNFSKADIKITPSFFGRLKTLPRLSKNIIIEVQREE